MCRLNAVRGHGALVDGALLAELAASSGGGSSVTMMLARRPEPPPAARLKAASRLASFLARARS